MRSDGCSKIVPDRQAWILPRFSGPTRDDWASTLWNSVLYDRAYSSISTIRPGEVNWEEVLAGAKWFHTSGITPALSDSAAAVTREALQAAREAGVTVSYDLNYRGKLWSPAKAQSVQEPLMEYVDVLTTTEEDTNV